MRIFPYIAYIFLLSSFAFYQRLPAQQQYDFKNFQVNDGLSSNTITAVLQDSKGFIWVGSRSGLNRYDGTHFKTFRNQVNNPFSLGDNSILCLFEDEAHHIWIGTYTGIYIYYPENEKFIFRKDLPTGEIRFIQSTTDHYIWIGTHNNLYRYAPAYKKLTYYLLPPGETLISNSQTTDSSFWIGRGNRYIFRYNAAKHNLTQYTLPVHVHGKNISNIQDISMVGDSAILIGTMTSLYWLQLSTQKLIDINPTPNQKIQIHQILQQSPHIYWLGTEDGIIAYNIVDHKSQLLTRQNANPYSLSDNVIYTLKKDRENGIWIGTFFGGLNYYSPKWNFFHKYFPNSPHSPLSGHVVHEITEDTYGNIWIGTEDGGLNKLTPTTGKVQFFEPGKVPGSIAYSNIHGLAAVGNQLWIGTYEHGLDKMDIHTGKVIQHYRKSDLPGSLDGDFIVSIYKGQHNRLFLGTWNNLFEYDKTKDNFRKIPFFNVQIQSIAQEKNGTIWIASYGKGIYFYNEKSGRHGNLNSKGPQHIPSNYINNITIDSKGLIWAATENGLFTYDIALQKIKTFNGKYGFSQGQVFKIIEDRQHLFWISTSDGLYCYDPLRQTQKLYTMAYGLPSQQFNYNSGLKDKDGILYFGTVNGMIRFNPANQPKDSYQPPIRITGFKINNSDNDSLLSPTNYNHTPLPAITLNHNQSSLSFEVSALTYALSGDTKIQYKLNGFDKEWNLLPNTGTIFYPRLSPGKYILQVRNAAQKYPGSSSSIMLTIQPPIWASVLAYILYSLIAIGILFLILRYYFLALKEKQKRVLAAFEITKQKEIYASKIDFFTHVAHEIRTPLTLIKLPLEKLKLNNNLDQQNVQNIVLMEKNTDRLIALTNELLDFRKAESDNYRLNFTDVDMTLLLQKTIETLQPLADQKQLNILIDIPRMHLIANVDEEAMHKILTNLINNAIKYGDKQINILLESFGSADTQFCIRVSNDGHLIPKEQKEKIFEPFTRLKESEKEIGTGIGLPLSRALTALHNGTLELDVNGGINSFVLRIPIEQTNTIHLAENTQSNIATNSTFITHKTFDPNKSTLLIVEDNIDILSFVSKELQSDYNILNAYNGADAITVVEKNTVDLIISDVMMPIMDGMELCKKIKEDVNFSHIPVIMLTAKNTLSSKIEGLETGADAYIEKPFAMEYLQAQVKSILQNRQTIQKHFAHSPLTHIKSIGASNKDKEFLETLQQLINQHMMDENLDVKELAQMLNMSKATLYRKIKAISNLSPNELINITKLKFAAELLAEGKYRIIEVAQMTGYTLQGNFSRDFSRQFGQTPSQFIENLKQQN